ncbi:MAG: pyridoxamine 5'-phosphate oxidase family protein [Candidatus Anammoxibacter sp.]
MKQEDSIMLRTMITEQRVLSLAVMIEGKPYVSLLPFVINVDLCSVFIQASDMAKHTAGLNDGAQFTILIHVPDRPDSNPMEIPRVSLQGTVQRLARNTDEFNNARTIFESKFNQSRQFFGFADFNLYQLNIDEGRYVAGFGRVYNIKRDDLRLLHDGC